MDFNMEIQDIIKALNDYFRNTFKAKGWFIGRVVIEPQIIKIYKKGIAELYYHTNDKNELIIKIECADRVLQGEENKLKKELLTKFITAILEKKDIIDSYGVQ